MTEVARTQFDTTPARRMGDSKAEECEARLQLFQIGDGMRWPGGIQTGKQLNSSSRICRVNDKRVTADTKGICQARNGNDIDKSLARCLIFNRFNIRLPLVDSSRFWSR